MRLYGLKDIADLIGVSKERVRQLADTDSFPEPLGKTSAGRVWVADDVDRWFIEWPRKVGRPRRIREH